MSVPLQVLRAMGKPVAHLPNSVRMPLVGWSWVVFNISVVWFGITHQHAVACSILAGGLDGTAIAVIAVAKASVRFQAGVTGLLGGLSLGRSTNENVLNAVAEKIHAIVDWAMNEVGPDSPIHGEVQGAVLRMVWTAMFVVLASLIAEWVRSAREEHAVIG